MSKSNIPIIKIINRQNWITKLVYSTFDKKENDSYKVDQSLGSANYRHYSKVSSKVNLMLEIMSKVLIQHNIRNMGQDIKWNLYE